MNRCLSLLAFLIVVQSNLLLAADENEKEVDTKEIIREAEETASEKVRESWELFQTDIQAPLDQARMELNRAITMLNQDKRFNDAKTVQKALADLEKTVLSKTVVIVIQPPQKPPDMKPEPIPPQKPLLERMAGKWIRTNHPDAFVISADRSAEVINQNTRQVIATGKLALDKEGLGKIAWSNNVVWMMRMTDDDCLAVSETDPVKNPLGDGLVLTREVGPRIGALIPRIVKLNQTTLGEFETSNGGRIGDGGLLFDSPEKPSFALTKQTYGYPLRVEFKATALPDRAYDIFSGLFCSRTDSENDGVQLLWGHHWNRGSSLLLFGQRIGLRHIPIVPNKEHTIVLVVDKSRNLTVQCDGQQLWTGQLPKEAVLNGQIKLGGGIGKVVYQQVSISEK